MGELAEYIDGLPSICGSEQRIEEAIRARGADPVFLPPGAAGFADVTSAFAIALHMHQPLIPAGGPTCARPRIISNLQYMMDHPGIGDNHNAPVFHWCYKRMGEFIPQLVDEGSQPRVMLDYSGTPAARPAADGRWTTCSTPSAHHLRPALPAARRVAGLPWGHAVAPSTPVQDYRLHVRAWQHHFAAIFGLEALSRVRGFSPSEMALPNHPGRGLRIRQDAEGLRLPLGAGAGTHGRAGRGRRGHPAAAPAAPAGRRATRGARPPASSRSSRPRAATPSSSARCSRTTRPRACPASDLAGQQVPPLVTQIADGENGGVMMNEFPPQVSRGHGRVLRLRPAGLTSPSTWSTWRRWASTRTTSRPSSRLPEAASGTGSARATARRRWPR